jgi:hypothetical protein
MVERAGLGVEVTEFYQEQNLKQLESEQQLVLERARTMCEEMGLPPMIVKVVWSAGATTSKRERPSLAHQLVNAVAKNTPLVDSQIAIEQDGQAGSPLPTMVDVLGIERWSVHRSHHWFRPRSSFVVESSTQKIQTRISEKNVRFRDYRGVCERLWLLLVVEGIGPSSWCELPESTRLHKYDSVFEQVFFFHRLDGRVIKLPTIQK